LIFQAVQVCLHLVEIDLKFFMKILSFFLRSWIIRWAVGSIIFLFIWSNWCVYSESRDFISSNMRNLPPMKYALILGTSNKLRNGRNNVYFSKRIDACWRLYRERKIRYVLVSGDNSVKSYNEPEMIRTALIRKGIPTSHIVLDYAGFDTYDSMVRAKEVFGLNSFIVVSQHFHNSRAVFIARRKGMDVYAYNAGDASKVAGFKMRIREYFARVKAYLDVLLNVSPKFLGKKEPIP
jgi:SanA protein